MTLPPSALSIVGAVVLTFVETILLTLIGALAFASEERDAAH